MSEKFECCGGKNGWKVEPAEFMATLFNWPTVVRGW